MLPPSLQPKAGAARLGVQVPANRTTLQSGCPESKAGSLVRRDQLKTLLYKNFQTLRTAVGKLALNVRPPEDAPMVPVAEQPALPSADRRGRHKKAGIALRSEIPASFTCWCLNDLYCSCRVTVRARGKHSQLYREHVNCVTVLDRTGLDKVKSHGQVA